MIDNKSCPTGNTCSTKINQCISCTVTQCKHHNEKQNYCTLDKIQVGTHENNPTVPNCTDCNSFVLK